MIYQIHHLHCGSMHPLCAALYGQKGYRAHLVCHCLLLETDQGLVLVDSGFGVQDYLQPQTRLGRVIRRFTALETDLKLTAIAQIQQLGFQASDVRHILLTHLDIDHAGGISDFPQATVHVLSSEFNAALQSNLNNTMRYRSAQFQQHRYWNFLEAQAGEAWFNFSRVAGFQDFADDILMIALPGHSPGHCGYAINTAQGWLFFCGDAYFSQRELNPQRKLPLLKRMQGSLAHNTHKRLKTLKKIQYLAKMHPEVKILCAHDPHHLEAHLNIDKE